VELHVENYYAPTGVPSTTDLSRIVKYDSPHLPAPLVELLSDSHRQIAAITHCLIRTVLDGMLPRMDTDGTLFLPSICAAYTNPQRVDPNPSTYKSVSFLSRASLFKLSFLRSIGTDRAFFDWRMLTGYMLQQVLMGDTSFAASRDRRINRAAQAFTRAFAPYANLRYSEDQRTGHLINVMRDAAGQGLWLFSQPCGFDFDWPDCSGGDIVVTPKVTKRFDERGRRLVAEQTVIEARRKGC
jgi:hypothetical protein